MPVDTSDYIKKTRLLAIANGKNVANARKFRALTQHDVYDPYRVVENTIRTDDFKNPVPDHNTFAAKQVSARKKTHF